MPNQSQPNILLVCFDSLSAFDHALVGNAVATPTLDKIISDSVQFSCTYTPCPQSSPARASLFTGLDPFVHGLWTNGVMLPPHVQTFPDILSTAGYANWLFGRWQMAGLSNWTTEPIRHGSFSHAEWAHGPLHRSRQNAYLLWLQQTAAEHYEQIFVSQPNADDTTILPEQRKAMSALPDDLSFNHWIGESVRRKILEQSLNRPFFAMAGMVVGSSQGSEPASENDHESLNKRSLQQADKALGAVLNALVKTGRAQDTAIIVTAARGTGDNVDENTLCEQAIKVPLFMHHSGFAAQTFKSPVSTIDIAPTVLELAGLPVPPSMQGKSLPGVLSGSSKPADWAMSRLRSTVGQRRHWKTALCSGKFKLVVSHGNPEQGTTASYQLFDLSTDPGEQHNLADNTVHTADLESMLDLMIDARCALENRTEPRIAKF